LFAVWIHKANFHWCCTNVNTQNQISFTSSHSKTDVSCNPNEYFLLHCMNKIHAKLVPSSWNGVSSCCRWKVTVCWISSHSQSTRDGPLACGVGHRANKPSP
jgi:hypothetical protein